MDKHDFDSSGLSNSEFVNVMRENFGQPPKRPAPHYTDTTQAPEDQDRGVLHSLGGLATNYGIVLGAIALFFVMIYQHGWPF